jgi:DNA invertase Pin-like site-specific DNA recombinase
VIYKPDRVARSMKELLVLLEDDLHAKDINLHILTGICAGVHRPNAASIADKMLFMVASMAAEMERDLIRERTRDGLAAAEAQGRKGGRPPALDPDTLAVALARRARGESVTAIAAHLKIGCSTLYRALQPDQNPGTTAPTPPRLRFRCRWTPLRHRRTPLRVPPLLMGCASPAPGFAGRTSRCHRPNVSCGRGWWGL